MFMCINYIRAFQNFRIIKERGLVSSEGYTISNGYSGLFMGNLKNEFFAEEHAQLRKYPLNRYVHLIQISPPTTECGCNS